jgi:FKBP-type peptidyl-prolyl cis-trans isomerase
MDFGIAKLLTDNSLTRTGTQMGTPTYMSPEQVRDVKDIDKRSDIYSLGVTLYFMLTGSAPYNSNTLSTFDIYNKIVHEPLPPLTSNIRFNEIIAKATAKNPNDRYSSCKVMADAFTADQKPAQKPTQTEDDEKTLIITEPVTPSNTKKTSIKPKPASPEPKPKPPVQQPKPAPIITSEAKKRFSIKQLIIAAAGLFVLIAAITIFTTGVFSGSSRLTNAVDSVSYALGVIEGQYLKEKFDTINLPAIEKGILKPSEYSDNQMSDLEVMFKYTRNNLKNHQYDENECAGFFAKYGSTLVKNAKGDMIYDLKNKLFFAGLKHVVTGNDLKISFKEAVAFANSFPTTASKMAALNNVAVEKAFFKDLKNNSRVKQASKGVFYEVISEGSGSSPNGNSNVSLKIVIKNLNGDVIENIENNYYTINFLIPGLQEVLLKMKKGSVYRIYVPSQAAYGVLGLFDSIKPYQAIICEVEMQTFLF